MGFGVKKTRAPATRRDWLKAALAFGGLASSGIGSDAFAQAKAASGRMPTIDDYLAMEEVGLVRPSPDGRWLAVEIARARNLPAQRAADLGGTNRSDIWLVDVSSGQSRQLTHGGRDGSGFWAPIWCPAGDSIAVLTNQGSLGSRPALLDPWTGGLRILGRRAVATRVNFGATNRNLIWCAWRGPDELLTVLLEEGYANQMDVTGDPGGYYDELWARTRRGELSVTSWDSRHPAVCGAASTLVSVNTRVSEAPRVLTRGAIRAVSLSRTQRYAALILASRPKTPSPDSALSRELDYNAYNIDMMVETQLSIFDLETGQDLGLAPGVSDLGFSDVGRHPQWHESDAALAVPAFRSGQKDRVYRVHVRPLGVEVVPARSPLDAELLTALLARAPVTHPAEGWAAPDRLDLSAQQPASTTAMSVPGTIVSLSGSDVAVIADKAMVAVDARGRPKDRQALNGAQLLYAQDPSRPTGAALFGSSDEVFAIERKNGKLYRRALRSPADGAMAMSSLTSSSQVLWADDRRPPRKLWATKLDGSPAMPLFSLDSYLADLWSPKVQRLDYSLPNGRPAIGALLLPPDYSPDKSYPVVIHGYASQVVSEASLKTAAALITGQIYRALLCAQGYVVAVPSLPAPPPSTPEGPLEYFSGLVEAFAKELVGKGLAMPGRIGFFGHSYGGFTALAVAARTKLITAVVASSAFADLITYHDVPYTWYERDTCAPSEARYHQGEFEFEFSPVMRMGGPPELNFPRYLANSPRYQLSRQSPPVLLLQGQLDAQGFRQADAVYMLLSRLGVPVRAARYWGEGHNLESPGNIRNAWEEVRTWFDAYLGPRASQSPLSHG